MLHSPCLVESYQHTWDINLHVCTLAPPLKHLFALFRPGGGAHLFALFTVVVFQKWPIFGRKMGKSKKFSENKRFFVILSYFLSNFTHFKLKIIKFPDFLLVSPVCPKRPFYLHLFDCQENNVIKHFLQNYKTKSNAVKSIRKPT